jgi:hypothetical protein
MIEILEQVVYILAFASVGITGVKVYHLGNKMWTRKHERSVAESISVTGYLMGLLPDVILGLNFLIYRQWQALLSYILYISFAVMSILIGSKLWVEGERQKGLWTLLKQALQNDTEEAGNFAKSFIKPSEAKTIIKILLQIALINEVLEPRSKEYIQFFANNWNIDCDWDELTSNRTCASDVNYIKLRQDLSDYLATNPPDKQVSQLKDIISVLVNIDEELSEQEQLILAELNGLFFRYLDKHDNFEVYHVVVSLQSKRQEEVIATSCPELSRYAVAEGHAYHSGPFYSKQYAEIICKQYRSLNLFSIVAASLPG